MTVITPVVSIGQPTISVAAFTDILVQANSPAALSAEQCYKAIADQGVDPAFALAIFAHESQFGKEGVASRTHNWGNLRAGAYDDYTRDGWAWYEGGDAWIRSAKDCARQLVRYSQNLTPGLKYCGHLDHLTPENIFWHWAPTGDGDNKPNAYAVAVRALVNNWRERYAELPPDPWEALATWQTMIEERLDDIEKVLRLLEDKHG